MVHAHTTEQDCMNDTQPSTSPSPPQTPSDLEVMERDNEDSQETLGDLRELLVTVGEPGIQPASHPAAAGAVRRLPGCVA